MLNLFRGSTRAPEPPLVDPSLPQRRVFVSFHYERDRRFYRQLVKRFADSDLIIRDRSLGAPVRSSNTGYVRRVIRERFIRGSSCTIVLCGLDTWARWYVDWEIQTTLRKKHGLLGISLPMNLQDWRLREGLPPRLTDNVDSGYATLLQWDEVMRNGPSFLQRKIEEAVNKSPTLIRNSRRPIPKDSTFCAGAG